MRARIFLLILSITTVTTLKSQTTINIGTFLGGGTVGDMITIYETLGFTVDIGTFGETTWDFTDIPDPDEMTVQFINAEDTGYLDFFEGAEIATHLFRTENDLDIFGFIKVLEDRILYYGEAVSDRTGQTVIPLVPPREIVFPLEYGDSWTYEGTESFIDPGKDVDTITIHSTIDSYGSVTLPNGKIADALLVRDYQIRDYGFGPDTTKVFFLLTDQADVLIMFLGWGSADTGEIFVGDMMWFVNDASGAEDELIVTEYKLTQNYPNPFNPSTTIEYSIPKAENVKLLIYDLLGNLVTTLVDDYQNPGIYNVNYDASYLSSGVYFAQLLCGGISEIIKMTLLK